VCLDAVEQPGLALSHGQPGGFESFFPRRALLPIAQDVQKGDPDLYPPRTLANVGLYNSAGYSVVGNSMPLVFVHGVANRQTPRQQAEIRQRDALFKRLVLPKGGEVFDPDWGSSAVTFDPEMPWLPRFLEAERFNLGGLAAAAPTGISKLAAQSAKIRCWSETEKAAPPVAFP
jgi:hypothetical protein